MVSMKWMLAAAAVAAGVGGATVAVTSGAAATTDIVVYQTATCGCCAKWVDHMRANGFTVRAEDVTDLAAVKQRYGVGMALQSCHTSIVGDHVFEGHIPADAIRKFLADPPANARGLAVPGMPLGSPGMESATPQPYDILIFDRNGGTRVFEHR